MFPTLPLLLALAPPSFTGSVGTRATGSVINGDALLSTRDTPIASVLIDGNVQGKGRTLDDTLTLSFDASAYFPFQTGYADRTLDEDELELIDDHDVPSARPFVVFSEGYVQWEPVGHLVLTLGKRRVVWGPGFLASPTDVLNPLRDPTDPASQRTGILMAKVDVPFDWFTISGLVSPTILEETAGVPTTVMVWPNTRERDPRYDGDLHFAAALRAYVLLFDTDINAWVVFSNLNHDDLEWHPRIAASFSRNIFTIHEIHGEVLLEQSSSRLYPNTRCADGELSFATCLLSRRDLFTQRRLESERLWPRFLVGWRPMLEDGTSFSVEYLYQSDGWMKDDYEDARFILEHVGDLQRAQLVPTSAVSAQESGQPNRVSFTPLRRHYVLASAQKPQVLDDFTFSGTLILSAEDLSGLASAGVLWSATEWLNLSANAFVPIPSALDPGDGEYDGAPFLARIVLEARAYF